MMASPIVKIANPVEEEEMASISDVLKQSGFSKEVQEKYTKAFMEEEFTVELLALATTEDFKKGGSMKWGHAIKLYNYLHPKHAQQQQPVTQVDKQGVESLDAKFSTLHLTPTMKQGGYVTPQKVKQDLTFNQQRVLFPGDRRFVFPRFGGVGVAGSTALPLVELREKIFEILRTTGIALWIESPPHSGKTALGMILEFENDFSFVTANSEERKPISVEWMEKHPRNIFVDEAQKLRISEIELLRDRARTHRIICAGLAGEPIDKCVEPLCAGKNNWRMCTYCMIHECHAPKCCRNESSEHCFVDTLSMSITTSRLTTPELVCTKDELVAYLLAIDTADCRKPDATVAGVVADAFLDFTSGIVGYTMSLLVVVCTHADKPFQEQFDAATFIKHMRSASTIEQFKGRFGEGIFSTKEMAQSLLDFLRSGDQPDARIGSLLCKKGALVKQQEKYFRASPFVLELLTSHAFGKVNHVPARGFPYRDCSELLYFLLAKLQKRNFTDSSGKQLHEDSVNSSIAYVLKSHLPDSGHHVGPAKRKSCNGYAQVDHEVSGVPQSDGTTSSILLEVCWSGGVKSHCERSSCERFTTVGDYPKLYNYRHAVVVAFTITEDPRPEQVISFLLDDPRCNFYKVYVMKEGFSVCEPCDRTVPDKGCKEVRKVLYAE